MLSPRRLLASSPFRVGKLPPEMLTSHVLQHLGTPSDSVLVGPGVGEDSAVLRLPGGDMVAAKCDPITGASSNIGRLVVHVNANDIAASGAVPTWLLLTALFPAGTEPSVVQAVSRQVHETCQELGVTVVGGHTELTDAVVQPVLCGTMLGTLLTKQPIRTGGAQPGDRVVLTKGVALEAMSILCHDRTETLVAAGVFADAAAAEAYGAACGRQLSVVADARVALTGRAGAAVTSLHDPTEGGLAGALHELADAAGVGFCIEQQRVPVAAEAAAAAAHFEVDVLELISSGALLLCCGENETAALLEEFAAAGIEAADIGCILEDASCRQVKRRADGAAENLPRPEQDALWDILGSDGE